MKGLIIKNMADIQAITENRGYTTFCVKPVVVDKDIDTCSVSFIEVPPGKQAWSYHYHDQSEEIFYIISGQGQLRSFYGEKSIKAGDMLCFPTGEKGGHSILNTSETEPLVYVDFEVKASKTDIVTLPDTEKFLITGNHLPDWTAVEIPKK